MPSPASGPGRWIRILLDAVYGISTMRETGQIPERAFGRSLTMRG